VRKHSSEGGGVPSTAAIAGHPIHPMLVPFPLAFLFSVVVTDLVQVATGDVFWARFSFWLLTAGLATALLAAIFGLTDFLTMKVVRTYAAGWIHFIGNITAVLLALINWLGRLNDPAGAVGGWDIALSAIVAVLLTFTGWFGGELSYRHGVGVHQDSDRV
jgi:uncharacterized membrane protein